MSTLVMKNENLIHWTIKKYYPSFVGDEDVIQCGMVGLYLAAHNYDPDKGVKFSTYAIQYIFNEIGKEVSKRNKFNRVEADLSLNEPTEDGGEVLDMFVTEEEGFDRVEADMILTNFVKTLTDKQNEIVDCILNDKLTPNEVATKLGISLSWVYRQLRVIRFKYDLFVTEAY